MRAYGDALVPALAAETLDPLRSVATTRQVDRVRLYVVQITAQDKLKVEAHLLSMDLRGTTVNGDDATVKTYETWAYNERDRESGKLVARKDYKGEVTYLLVRDPASAAWLVDDIQSELAE